MGFKYRDISYCKDQECDIIIVAFGIILREKISDISPLIGEENAGVEIHTRLHIRSTSYIAITVLIYDIGTMTLRPFYDNSFISIDKKFNVKVRKALHKSIKDFINKTNNT